MSKGTAKVVASPSKAPKGVKFPLLRMRQNVFNYIDNFGDSKKGDLLIDYRYDSTQWSSPQDIELIIHLLAHSIQSITYAEIKVDQSSHIHDAQIIGGGIGQDNIRILIRACNTYWLRFEVRLYGEQQLLLQEMEEMKCKR